MLPFSKTMRVQALGDDDILEIEDADLAVDVEIDPLPRRATLPPAKLPPSRPGEAARELPELRKSTPPPPAALLQSLWPAPVAVESPFARRTEPARFPAHFVDPRDAETMPGAPGSSLAPIATDANGETPTMRTRSSRAPTNTGRIAWGVALVAVGAAAASIVFSLASRPTPDQDRAVSAEPATPPVAAVAVDAVAKPAVVTFTDDDALLIPAPRPLPIAAVPTPIVNTNTVNALSSTATIARYSAANAAKPSPAANASAQMKSAPTLSAPPAQPQDAPAPRKRSQTSTDALADAQLKASMK